MQDLATAKNGHCLSKKYINAITKLKWICEEKHTWEATPNKIRNGSWCPKCGMEKFINSRRGSLDEYKNIAKERGGECLSEKFINARTKLKWKCDKGHEWEAQAYSIKTGTWCPQCSGNISLDIETARSIAEERGGECLSNEYINIDEKLLWKCYFGHEWKNSLNKIKNGNQWCPTCNKKNLGELIVREYFENCFNKKFPNLKPKWLKNNLGNIMELDGYCKDLKIAFEHQGVQHYKYNKFYHKNEAEFKRRVLDDEQKIKLCTQRGILLIIVPEVNNLISIKDLPFFLKAEFKKHGIRPIKYPEQVNLKLFSIYSVNRIHKLKKIAEERNGSLLTDLYIGVNAKYRWRCSKGHEWEAKANNIIAGKWCPECAKNKKSTIETMNEIAKKKEGICVSDKYINNREKLIWRCKEGHEWDATPNNIIRGTWCPECSRNRKDTIENMKAIAQERGGKCLSEKYFNQSTKLKWICKYNHVWEAQPKHIKAGSWCPVCAMKK